MNIPRLLLAGFMAAMLLACSSKEPEQRIVLGFSQLGEDNAWRVANSDSIRSAAATSNIDLRFANAKSQQENQISDLRKFIADRVDVIAFAPVVATGWDTVLAEAKAAGIPVILTDRAVSADPSLYVGVLGSDYVEEGRKAARWVVEQFPGAQPGVNILQIEGSVGSPPAEDRKQGFEEIIGQHAGFHIVASRPGNFARDSGKLVMAEALRAREGKLHVVFAHNDDMALGAIDAIEAAELEPGKDILIVSVDAVREAFEALIAGKLNATVECNPLLGPQLMTSVTEVVAGRPIPKRIVVDEKLFTQQNARQFIQSRKY